jgi:hypothetical protein
MGVTLLVMPARFVRILFASTEGLSAEWARMFGCLCYLLGCYYGGSAAAERSGALPAPLAFYRATVVGRCALCVTFGALYTSGLFAQPGICVLGAVDALCAAHMHLALQRDAAAARRSR